MENISENKTSSNIDNFIKKYIIPDDEKNFKIHNTKIYGLSYKERINTFLRKNAPDREIKSPYGKQKYPYSELVQRIEAQKK